MASISRPTVSADDVPFLVHNTYGLKVKVLRELNSYDDQNFHVEVIPGSTLPSNVTLTNPHGYVFKIFNSLDSAKPRFIETQIEIIRHAKGAGYPTPDPIPTTDYQYQKLLTLPRSTSQDDKLEHFVICLFNFIPGPTLDQVTLTPQLCYEVGWFAGKLDVILQGFLTEDLVLASITRKWNMTQIPNLRDKFFAITCQEQQRIIEEIINQFERSVLSFQDKFTKGLIHGDFNDCNILVSSNCNYMSALRCTGCSNHVNTTSSVNNVTESYTPQNIHSLSKKSADRISNSENAELCAGQPWHVSGAFDFGDTTFSLYVFEVATAIVHVMINKHGIPALQAASFVLAGYLNHISLTEVEINHLKLCVCARFAQSLVMGYFSITQDPENCYILTHASRVWPVLKSLWEMPDSQVLLHFMEHVHNH